MDPRKPLILVADADPNIRRQMAAPLQEAGYETVEARNGRDALELVQRFRPELVLVDGNMPLIDGYKVAQYVKSDPQTSYCKVVLVAGDGADLKQAVQSGADECVVKPINKHDLLEKVKKLMALKPAGGQTYGYNARREARKETPAATVSWGSKVGNKYEVMFKERLLDISVHGMAFEHVRCDVCTGYEKDTIHPNCPFSAYARCFHNTEPLSFVITLPNKRLIQVMGKAAHIFQPDNAPRTERIGIVFTDVSKEAQKFIKEYVEEQHSARA